MNDRITAPTTATGHLGISHGWWVVICIIYALSPIDLLPALLLGPLGIFDDLGVMCFGFLSFVRWTRARSAAPERKSQFQTDTITTARVVHASSLTRPSLLLPVDSAPLTAELESTDSTRLLDAQPPMRGGGPSEFEVQIVDPDDGTSRWVEVCAGTADQARTLIASKGADGQIARVRLKRVGSAEVGTIAEERRRA